MKFLHFLIWALSLSFDGVRSREQPRHHGHHKHTPICPDCVWKLTETYAQYIMNTLLSGGPKDGRCRSGYEKWIYHAEPYGLEDDVCCCLKVVVAPTDCSLPSAPECPAIPKIGRNEWVADYFDRVSKELKDAPANGCCPAGTFKWIFEKALTKTNDICSCIDTTSFVDNSPCVSKYNQRSKCISTDKPIDPTTDTSAGPADTTASTISTASSSLTTMTSVGPIDTTATTVPSENVICPECVIGLTDTFVNYIKKMFDNHGPSDGVCPASNTKISFPGLAFGYNYDICCCVPEAPPIDCSIPGQITCPATPGVGPSESLGSYFKRTADILANAPENGCCGFGTVKLQFFSFFTGLPKNVCTCLDFTKVIDPSITTAATTAVTTPSTLTSIDTTVTSADNVCPQCVFGLTDSLINYIKMMFDKGPINGACSSTDTRTSFPGLVFGYSYDVCCCSPASAPPIDCNLPGQPICPPTPGIGPFESLGSYFNRTAAILALAPENGCCNFGTVQTIMPKSFTGFAKDVCTCVDFTKAIDLSITTTAVTTPSTVTTPSGNNICQDCVFGTSDTFINYIKLMFDKGPSNGICLGTDTKVSFPGFVFGYTSDVCCCVKWSAPPTNCGFGQPTCPTAPGIGLSEGIGEYLNRTISILTSLPENGCCNFGTVRMIMPTSFTGFAKDVCTCVDFTKSIDLSITSDTTLGTTASTVPSGDNICQACVFGTSDTFINYIKLMFDKGPSNGICLGTDAKVSFPGFAFGYTYDVCCCAKWSAPPANCGFGQPTCPTTPGIGLSEGIGEYLNRTASILTSMPENGCCNFLTVRIIMPTSFTGFAKDICTCLDFTKAIDLSIISGTTLGTTAVTTPSGDNICQACVFGTSDTFINYIKLMFDKGPSNGICLGTDAKVSFPGFAFGYTYDVCCCAKWSAPPTNCGFGQPTCPSTPGIGLSEGIGEYLNRTASILTSMPENGCCNFGTVRIIMPTSFTGFAKDICTCLDFTKAIDLSIISGTTLGSTAVTTPSTVSVCPVCVFGMNDTFINYMNLMFDKGPSNGVCLGTDVRTSFPGFVFGYTYDICCCAERSAPPIDCNVFGQPICPTTPSIGPSEGIGAYFNRNKAVLATMPENGCCNFGSLQVVFPTYFTGFPKDACTCLDFTKLIDFSII